MTPSTVPRVIVLGGGYAGVLAARRLARAARVRVTLVNASDRFCERIRLHQLAAGEALPVVSMRSLLHGTGVDFVCATATALDPVARTLTLTDRTLRFDHLVLALGSRVDIASVPGVAAFARVLDPGEAERVAEKLPSARRILVLGGGLTGLEAAAEIAERHPACAVTLATDGLVAPRLSPSARARTMASLAALHVVVREGLRVREITSRQALFDDETLGFDLCLWAGGFVAPPFARDAGLAVNARGQVRVDRCLRAVSHPWIYAVGDCAAPDDDPGCSIEMGCKTAMPMGAHAADNLARRLAGDREVAFDFRDFGHCISLGRREGIIQVRDLDGAATRAILGRTGAFLKEQVCRYTLRSLRAEGRVWRYRWMRTGRVRAPLALGVAA